MNFQQQPPNSPQQSLYNRDEEHIKLLSVFHYVFAGFAVCGLLFVILHASIMGSVFMNDELWKNEPSPPPEGFFNIFIWIYLLCGVFIVATGLANFLSARWMRRYKNRTLSLIVAGINCLSFPLGPTLGIFTIIVLMRATVDARYRS